MSSDLRNPVGSISQGGPLLKQGKQTVNELGLVGGFRYNGRRRYVRRAWNPFRIFVGVRKYVIYQQVRSSVSALDACVALELGLNDYGNGA